MDLVILYSSMTYLMRALNNRKNVFAIELLLRGGDHL